MSVAFKQATTSLRPMSKMDLVMVLTIEKENYIFPWTWRVFEDCLRIGHSCWIIAQDDNVSGYGIMSMTAGDAHILNLCIQSSLQNKGLGQKILTHMIHLAETYHANGIFLEVRPSNWQALKIYKKLGFTVIGHRKDYYSAEFGYEDALILAKQLTNVVEDQ